MIHYFGGLRACLVRTSLLQLKNPVVDASEPRWANCKDVLNPDCISKSCWVLKFGKECCKDFAMSRVLEPSVDATEGKYKGILQQVHFREALKTVSSVWRSNCAVHNCLQGFWLKLDCIFVMKFWYPKKFALTKIGNYLNHVSRITFLLMFVIGCFEILKVSHWEVAAYFPWWWQ